MPHEPKVGELPALLPCPFCGGQAKFEYREWNPEDQSGDDGSGWVTCVDCHACVPSDNVSAEDDWNRRPAEREARKDEARKPIDTEYAWLVDGEWQGSSTSARECLRYIEQYRVDGEIEVTRIETYQYSEAELHAAALQAEQPEGR